MSGLITMPRMGETMDSGRVSAWLKKPGDTFVRGETIAEIETDKVTVEMPALDAGRLTEILVAEGSEVAVGEALGRYEASRGQAATPVGKPAVEEVSLAQDHASAKADPPLTSEADQVAPVRAPDQGERRRATPLARRLARQAGLDLTALAGSGRRGRIEKSDVEAALAADGSSPPATFSLPPLQYIDLPDGRMAYREWMPSSTPRRTVLLLHGFSAEAATWASVAAGLARAGTHVIGPDLPGHGATAIEAPTFEAVCDAVAAFAPAVELEVFDLVAHSMGGAIAARLTAAGRLRPGTLTLLAPAGLGETIDGDFVHGMAQIASGGALAHLLRRLARRAPSLSRPQLDAMARTLAEGRLQGLAAVLAPDGRQGIDIVPDLAALRVPARLIWGLDDRIMPWTQVAAAPPRVAIHLIPDAGHMPHWDKPQDLAALLA